MADIPDSIITRYRPGDWAKVFGHASEVRAIQDAVINRTAHGFLFSGPPGFGKTTLAYLAAKGLGSDEAPVDLTKVSAAVYTGVDDMRELMATLRYVPMGGETKVILFDEAHRLSKNAFDSLLIFLEEPPPWVFFMFCTTEAGKIPAAIKRRCLSFELKPLTNDELFNLLSGVAKAEGLDTPEDVLDVCAREARGSPGVALANLTACVQAQDRKEAASLLRTATEDTEAGQLAKGLLEAPEWSRIQRILAGLDEARTDPETIRYTVRAYFTAIMLKTQDANRAAAIANVLDAFSQPFYHMADVILAVCKVVFQQT